MNKNVKFYWWIHVNLFLEPKLTGPADSNSRKSDLVQGGLVGLNYQMTLVTIPSLKLFLTANNWPVVVIGDPIQSINRLKRDQ